MKSATEISWPGYIHASISLLLTLFSEGVLILLFLKCVGLIGPIRW
jgi:hypothetical protein